MNRRPAAPPANFSRGWPSQKLRNRLNVLIRRVTFPALVLILASCQSVSIDDSFRIGGAQTVKAKPVATVGTGPTRIAMIVHRTAGGATSSQALEQQNGAALAVRQLGEKTITLAVFDGQDKPQLVQSLVKGEMAKGARLVILPGDVASVSSASTLVSNTAPAMVALGTTPTSGIYAFMPTAADGLSRGIAHAAGKGRWKVVLVGPSGVAASLSASVAKRLPDRISVAGVATYAPGQSGADFIRANSRLLRSANIIAFADGSANVADIAKALKQNPRFADLKMIGREDWSSSLLSQSALQGTIVATTDTSGTSLIEGPYQTAYKRTLTPQAAYAYDVVALAAGLVRSRGNAGLARSTIESPTGFRGTMGLFRLQSTGSVERLYRITKIENGRLKTVQSGPDGF